VKDVMINAGAAAAAAKTENDLQLAKAQYLGKKSELVEGLKSLSGLEGEERKRKGAELNTLKASLESIFASRQKELLDELDALPPLDLTQPGIGEGLGHAHPVTLVMGELYASFTRLGFAIVDSNEIENDWYNFEALNMPPHHPARDMQDTFYIKDSKGTNSTLPRTHTSGMQVRFMEQNEPPFKIIVPGKVFRNEDEDRTHLWSFTQVEGLVVGEGVSVAHLKGTLLAVMKDLLGEDTEIRLRPSFFPYTEPSIEIDVSYKGEWLELLGAGMVHPKVLENAGVDPEKYSGFAFGVGPERIAMVKYGITDLRNFWRPNLAYLEQF
jgi:phenylalanyl-tRNA synthetase alpha chain